MQYVVRLCEHGVPITECVRAHGLFVAQCVLGCSSQPIEVSRSIIKACHWLVHELGRPIRATDVRSE